MTRLDAVGNTEIVEEALKAIFEANPNLPFKFDGNSISSSSSHLDIGLLIKLPLKKACTGTI